MMVKLDLQHRKEDGVYMQKISIDLAKKQVNEVEHWFRIKGKNNAL